MKRHTIKPVRLWLGLSAVLICWVVLVARLIQIQIAGHERATVLASRQAEGWVTVPANRGRIYDRNGRILAANQSRLSFAAVPKQWRTARERERAVQRIRQVAGGSRQEWLNRFKQFPEFVYVVRAADERTARRIRSWGDAAVFALSEPGRMHPAGAVGRDLLGGVNIDNQGISGIERAFEDLLADRPARGCVRYDARRAVAIDPLPASLARDGHDICLSVDWHWQEIVERELQRCVQDTRAEGGGAIFMTPLGAIRALAYVTNPAAEDSPSTPRCRPVTDLFEPGSIFKVITAAALLAEGRVNLTDSVYADSGSAVFNGRRIRDSEPHLWLTFDSSFIVSSNIAFGKWAQLLPGPRWFRWCRDFGFGEVTRVGLPAEPEGFVPDHDTWTELALAQLAMGHSVAVTPLQMVTAFAALANGGDLYRPFLVDAVIDAHGDTTRSDYPRKIRHLLAPDVVETMGKLLARVVTEGTAKPARSEAIAIAGKTGTAQKVKPDGGGYYQHRFWASFVGYFPADAPQVVGLVYLDEPKTTHFGGWTAAPAFTRIAERLAVMHPELLRYPESESGARCPDDVPDPPVVAGRVPRLLDLPLARAVLCAARAGYEVDIHGAGRVWQQSPAAGTPLGAGQRIVLEARCGPASQEGHPS